MKKIGKKLLAIAVSLAMVVTMIPMAAFAEPTDGTQIQKYMKVRVNPFAVSSTQKTPKLYGAGDSVVSPVYTDYESAGEFLREQMVGRQSAVTVMYKTTEDLTEEKLGVIFDEILDAALEHTGNPDEGDYIRWQIGDIGCDMGAVWEDGAWIVELPFSIPYYTTASQESTVASAVSTAISGMSLSGKNDYQKVKSIYDYITSHVTYDNAHVNDDTYTLAHTAYAAIIDGTSVCQGYALLFYNMALTQGIDSRLISGIGNGGPHGWNIVKIGSKYYNLDSTWDAGKTTYSYFLKNEANFDKHQRDNGTLLGAGSYNYTSTEFNTKYPMSSVDYYDCNGNHTWNSGTETAKATCDKAGTKTFTCTMCGDTKTEAIDALGHAFSTSFTVDKKATCKEVGSKSKHCTRAGCTEKSEVTEIPLADHSYGAWQTVKAATCTVAGSEKRTCSVCGYAQTRSVAASGHKYSTSWTVDKAATYSAKGSKSYHCTVCDAKGSVTAIPMQSLGAAKIASIKLGAYNKVKLSWSSVTGANAYIVAYKKSSASKWTTKTVKGTSMTTGALTGGVKYQFKVRAAAKNSSGSIANKGAYSAVKSTTTLKKVVLSSVEKASKTKAKVTWKSVKLATGFQISKSTSKSKKSIVKTVVKGSAISTTVTAKKGKTYYYSVRAYKTVNGKKIYAPWSTVKKLKIK